MNKTEQRRCIGYLIKFIATKIKFDIFMHKNCIVEKHEQIGFSIGELCEQQACLDYTITKDDKSFVYQVLMSDFGENDNNLFSLKFSLVRHNSKANTENIMNENVAITLSDFIQEVKPNQITNSESIDEIKGLANRIADSIATDLNKL